MTDPSLGFLSFEEGQEVGAFLEGVFGNGGSPIQGHESFEVGEEELSVHMVTREGFWRDSFHMQIAFFFLFFFITIIR